MRARARPGARVLVQFRQRERIGWIDRVSETVSDAEKVKPILGVLDAAPSVTPAVLRLCRWIAEYYLAPLGIVIRTALPAGLTDSSTDYISLSGGQIPGRDLAGQELKLIAWLREQEGPQPIARIRR